VKKSEKCEKSEKKRKMRKNRLEFCFASKQKLLNRSEAKNLKRKIVKKPKKMRKNAENSEKKLKKAKKTKKIDLKFASLCFASKRKVLK
jgi:hypothetical protein